jgi:hypothetical protein
VSISQRISGTVYNPSAGRGPLWVIRNWHRLCRSFANVRNCRRDDVIGGPLRRHVLTEVSTCTTCQAVKLSILISINRDWRPLARLPPAMRERQRGPVAPGDEQECWRVLLSASDGKRRMAKRPNSWKVSLARTQARSSVRLKREQNVIHRSCRGQSGSSLRLTKEMPCCSARSLADRENLSAFVRTNSRAPAE